MRTDLIQQLIEAREAFKDTDVPLRHFLGAVDAIEKASADDLLHAVVHFVAERDHAKDPEGMSLEEYTRSTYESIAEEALDWVEGDDE